jgi:hypothetical protein
MTRSLVSRFAMLDSRARSRSSVNTVATVERCPLVDVRDQCDAPVLRSGGVYPGWVMTARSLAASIGTSQLRSLR